MTQTYTPKPLDTSAFPLPDELNALLERLAANTHDVWARQRLAEGWRHGPERNDASKEHPDLVPYDQLPEGEKEYERSTAFEAIKVILALGYRIVPPDRSRSSSSGHALPGQRDSCDGASAR